MINFEVTVKFADGIVYRYYMMFRRKFDALYDAISRHIDCVSINIIEVD